MSGPKYGYDPFWWPKHRQEAPKTDPALIAHVDVLVRLRARVAKHDSRLRGTAVELKKVLLDEIDYLLNQDPKR